MRRSLTSGLQLGPLVKLHLACIASFTLGILSLLLKVRDACAGRRWSGWSTMDINRYYVPPKPRQKTQEEKAREDEASRSRFLPKRRLPTPQAFFERQRTFKEQDRQAMLRFAKKTFVKHNLKLRRHQLKSNQQGDRKSVV